MANNPKNTDGTNEKNPSAGWLPIAAAVILVAAVILTFTLRGRNDNTDTVPKGETQTAPAAVSSAPTIPTAGGSTGLPVIPEGESLVIPVDEITATAAFYTFEVDGTEMEVLAVRDSGGNIRTAFNTCQVCYGSGRGYFKQEGNVLICQNCGNRFTVDQVEIESGGCNPWPIFPENKTVTEESISISYDFLRQYTRIFANWKKYS